MEYPQFYKKGNRCLKRESDTTGIEVQVPEPGKKLPLIHTPVTYPSAERLNQEVATMQPCDQLVYESYLFTFFQQADSNRQALTAVREKRKLPPPPNHAVS